MYIASSHLIHLLDLSVRQRVHRVLRVKVVALLVLPQQLSRPVSQQLVQSDLHLEGGHPPLLEDLVVGEGDECGALVALVRRRDHVAQVYVLEALALTDLVV